MKPNPFLSKLINKFNCNRGTKLGYFCNYQKISNHPKGENSPNLATLSPLFLSSTCFSKQKQKMAGKVVRIGLTVVTATD
jgi:hypothetical protein